MKFNLSRHQDKKNKILNATYKCIYEKGIAEVSMRLIAKEAKINQSNLHYYFKTKENLLIEFIRVLFDRFIYDITKGYKASDPPGKKLQSLFEAGKEHIRKQKEMYIVFADAWSLSIRNPAMQNIFFERYKNLSEVIEIIIEEGVRKGVFENIKKDILPTFFIAFVEGFGLQWHMRKQSFNLQEHFDIFFRNLKETIYRQMPKATKLRQKPS